MAHGFIGVGQDRAGDGAWWRSADGRSWRCIRGVPSGSRCAIEAPGSYPDTPTGSVTTVTLLGSDGTNRGAVAVTCENYGDACAAYKLWHTTDGTHWRQAHIAGLPSGVIGLVAAGTAVSGGRIVAVGAGSCHGTPGAVCSPAGLIATSTNGTTWRAVTPAPGEPDVIWTNVRAGPGGFIATGNEAEAGGLAGSAVVSTSSDGLAWTPAFTLPFAAPDIVIPAGGGPGFVVVADTADGWASWSSSNGLEWTSGPDQAAFQGHAVNGLVDTGHGLVAVGRTIGDVVHSSLWTSSDGQTWTESDQPWPLDSSLQVAADGRQLAVMACGNRCTVWVSPIITR